jgi:hypothetical protein
LTTLTFVGGGVSAKDAVGNGGFATLVQLQSATAINAARPLMPLRSTKRLLLSIRIPQPDRVVIESTLNVVRQS